MMKAFCSEHPGSSVPLPLYSVMSREAAFSRHWLWRTRWGGAAAIVLLLQLFLGNHPAVGSTVRYVQSCAEMLGSGDWLVPHLGGTPYLEKPILAYWLGALSMGCCGGSDRACQLPAALSMIVILWSMMGIAGRWRGARTELLILLVGLGSLPLLGMSGTFTPDAPLSACMAVVWWSWGCFISEGRTRHLLVFWLAIAFGVLTKGPEALALPGVAVATHCLATQGWRGLWPGFLKIRPIVGSIVVLAVNLPWTLAVWWRDPRLIKYFYLTINLGAMYDRHVNHPGPLYYYLPLLPALLAPWFVVGLGWFGVSARQGWRGLRAARVDDKAVDAQRWHEWLLCAAVAPLVFLSLTMSKLPSYVLPLVPVWLLLMVDGMRRTRAWAWAIVVQAALLVVAVSIALPLTGVWSAWVDAGWSTLGIGVLFVGSVIGGQALWAQQALRGHHQRGLLLAGMGAVVALVVGIPALPLLRPRGFPGRLADAVVAAGNDDSVVVLDSSVAQEYHLDRHLGRRPLIYGRARERGLGHWVEYRPRSDDRPHQDDGTPMDPYHLSGDILPDHPWLCSTWRLSTIWRGAKPAWFFTSDDLPAAIRGARVPTYDWGVAGDVHLYGNRHP